MSGDVDAESVGFGCPPPQHRIRDGEVRNPWGRKGKPRPQLDFLDEPFELRIDGRTRVVTRSQALDLALFKEAIAGNVSAITALERRRRDRALAAKGTADDEHLASDDQRAFDRYIDRVLRDRISSGAGKTTPRSDGKRTRRPKPRPDDAGGPA